MQIRPTNSLQSTQAVNFQNRIHTEQTGNSLPVDQLELSAEAKLLETKGDLRMDRITEIRTQIAQGQYDTPEKLEVALSRMFDEIA
jgi:negative regulator of flagellin synthesis FlgM